MEQLFKMILEQEQKKQKTEKQQRIITSAITLFAEQGYSNTSTAEIAKNAGVAEGTIYKHYGKKEDLLMSIIVPFLKDFFPTHAKEVLHEIFTENTSFRGILKAFLINRIEFLKENREIFQVLVKEMFYREELKKELLPYFYKKVSPLYIKVIEEYKRRGEIASIPNEDIVRYSLQNFAAFFISRFVLFEKENITNEEIEQFIDLLMNGLSGNKEL